MKSKSQEQWRKYFESGNCSIYQIIFHAIKVAALDDPEEFKLRRKQIVERLYSCQFTGCCCCDHQTEGQVHSILTQVFKDCQKGCPNNNKSARLHANAYAVDSEVGGGRGLDQADELGHKIEDDNDNIRHVLQIKEELENSDELTETDIYESLRRLQLMVLSVDVLEVTKIGSIISDLQQHWSRQISLLARSIADGWKSMIVELVDTVAETAEGCKKPGPDIVLEDWRGFPSAEFVSQPPVEFSEKFLDDMDDDENYPGKEKGSEIMEGIRQRKGATENKTEMMKREKIKQEWVEKLINCRYNSSNRAPSNPKRSDEIENMIGGMDQRKPANGNRSKMELQLTEDAEFMTPIIKRQKVEPTQQSNSIHHANLNLKKDDEVHNKKDKHTAVPTPNLKNSRKGWAWSGDTDTAMEEKLETTKRRLEAGYQAYERAKRNIQLIPELRYLPKQTSTRSMSRSNFGNQARRR